MRYLIVLLALVAFGACNSSGSKPRAADQELLSKQLEVVQLLQKISQPIPNQQLQNLGASYDIENNVHQYSNPIIVKYYAGAVKAGLVQPKGTAFSSSVSQLRKEASLLYRILLGAKDYQTFLKTAAWARVHVNEGQVTKAVISAVLTRPDTQGIILPPIYEILPQHHLDSRIIQEAQNIAIQGIQRGNIQNIVIPVNYSSLLSNDEQQVSYFTQDVGLAAYYAHIDLIEYILGEDQQQQQILNQPQFPPQIVGKYSQQLGLQDQQGVVGHGAQYLYLHQQLLARYELNRLSNGLGPIRNLDFKNVQALYQPHLRNLNGLELPSRPENLPLQPQNVNLIQRIYTLQQRLLEAIDSGLTVNPQGVFLPLYQSQGVNILGDLIEGCGRSINPRYYGSIQAVARKLLGNTPEAQNIWDYNPSALELGQTAVYDPAFYQLHKKIVNLYQRYQKSLPAYQYNDLVLPGVTIQNVDVSQLVTLFSDYYIDLDAVTAQRGQSQQQQQEQVQQHILAHLKRLDHKPYQVQITVHSEQNIPNAIVRVFLGPKHDYEGKPVSISQSKHLFVELDQSVQTLRPGQNVIIRNSQKATGQSPDLPTTQHIVQGVNGAIRSQEPFYITEPHQVLSFPARLSLPKGNQQGFPLQILVVISGPNALNIPYGPVIPEESLDFQAGQFQIVSPEQYEQLIQQGQLPQVVGGLQQNIEVLPENLISAQQQIPAVRNHYAQIYSKYHGQYPNTQIQNPVGQGQDMTYTLQGIGLVSGVGAQVGLSGQQLIPAQQTQQQIEAAVQGQRGEAAQLMYGQQHQQLSQHKLSEPQRLQGLQGFQGVRQGVQGLQGLQGIQVGQGLQSGQGLQGMQPGVLQGAQGIQQGAQGIQQGLQGVQQGLQGVQQGLQQGLPQGLQQGLQQGVQQGLQGIQAGLQGINQGVASGVQGVQQAWDIGQGIRAVRIPYGMQGVRGVSGTHIQGGIAGTGTVASGQQHAGGFQGIYAQPQTVQDEAVREYYQNQPISKIIGGAISLDGKPLGFPLDRPLTLGALSVPNVFVKEVLVFHEGQPTNDITQ